MPASIDRRGAVRAALALSCVMAAAAVGSPAMGASPTTSRVSVSSKGVETNDDSSYARISATGRFIVFMGESDKLVPADKNGQWDVFLRDRKTGKTEWISRGRPGTVNDDLSTLPDVSADGRFVVFESSASNLVKGDTLGFRDIFLRDRALGRTTRISRASGGGQANGNSSDAAISADGRSPA
jgi:Tol biopolymer transport system component